MTPRRQPHAVHGLPSTIGRHGGCALVQGRRTTSCTSARVTPRRGATRRADVGRRQGAARRLAHRRGLADNPYHGSANAMKRRVFTYGHRNVQGLARRADGTIWSVEHGQLPRRRGQPLSPGGNYGWNPVRRHAGDPAYNEGANSPMTDHALPGTQRGAALAVGRPDRSRRAAATFVYGSHVGCVRTARSPSPRSRTSRCASCVQLQARPRSVEPARSTAPTGGCAVRPGPDGALYLTTSNGGNDKILKVTPS